jgi:hypothetical protein
MLVLDRNVKDMYFQSQWSGEHYAAAGMKQLKDVVSCLFLRLQHTDISYQFDSYFVVPEQATTTAVDTVQGMLGPNLYSVLILPQRALQHHSHHFIMVARFL